LPFHLWYNRSYFNGELFQKTYSKLKQALKLKEKLNCAISEENPTRYLIISAMRGRRHG
jgi:hypothetical protein